MFIHTFYLNYISIDLHRLMTSNIFVLVQDISSAPAENCATVASVETAAEVGQILTVQRHGADAAYVHVCSSGSLDGLHLVHHWAKRDGD